MNFIYTLARFRHLTLTVSWFFSGNFKFSFALSKVCNIFFSSTLLVALERTSTHIQTHSSHKQVCHLAPGSLPCCLPLPLSIAVLPAACLMCNFCRCSLKIITSALGQENGNGKKAAKLTAEETWWKEEGGGVAQVQVCVGWVGISFTSLSLPILVDFFFSSNFLLFIHDKN